MGNKIDIEIVATAVKDAATPPDKDAKAIIIHTSAPECFQRIIENMQEMEKEILRWECKHSDSVTAIQKHFEGTEEENKTLKAQLATCKEALEKAEEVLDDTIGEIEDPWEKKEKYYTLRCSTNNAWEKSVRDTHKLTQQALATFKPEIQFCDHCDDPLGKKYITRGDSRFCSDECEGVFFDEINAEKKL